MLSGSGCMFDAMDIGLLSFVLVALAQEWGLSQGQVGTAISVGLLGMFVGAAVSGVLADRYGRKAILLATMLVFSVATGLTALVWGYGALLVLRFVTGRGVAGGEHARRRGCTGEAARADARTSRELLGVRLDPGRDRWLPRYS